MLSPPSVTIYTTHNFIIIIKMQYAGMQTIPKIEIVTDNGHGRSGSRKNELYYVIGTRATTLQLYYRRVVIGTLLYYKANRKRVI